MTAKTGETVVVAALGPGSSTDDSCSIDLDGDTTVVGNGDDEMVDVMIRERESVGTLPCREPAGAAAEPVTTPPHTIGHICRVQIEKRTPVFQPPNLRDSISLNPRSS